MRKRLSSAGYSGIILIGFVLLSALAVALPHDPYIRWQSLKGTIFERTKYQYERLSFDSEPVDVVFIGSSRTASAVNPAMLEADLAERGAALRVVDLSLPSAGMDIRVAQAREALRAKPETKLLVIAVVEAMPRDGHQAFEELASVREILASPLLINRRLPATLARLPMRQMKLAAATALPQAFDYQAGFKSESYPGSSVDYQGGPTVDPSTLETEEHAAALLAESDRRKREITPPLLPADLSQFEFGVSRSSIEAILDLAEANGTRVAFLFLPFYHGFEEPREMAWYEERGSVWIADWMRETPRYYKDAAHSSPLVQPEVNDWLAERIVEELTLADADQSVQ